MRQCKDSETRIGELYQTLKRSEGSVVLFPQHTYIELYFRYEALQIYLIISTNFLTTRTAFLRQKAVTMLLFTSDILGSGQATELGKNLISTIV